MEIRNDQLKYRKHKTARISLKQPRHCPERRREHSKHRRSDALIKRNPLQSRGMNKELDLHLHPFSIQNKSKIRMPQTTK